MERLPKYTVAVFGCLVALLVVACAYFADNRHTDIDELALYNPAYMTAHYGRLTYPAEGYFDRPMIVHPPIHTGFIGLWQRFGMTWYYAAGTPTALFLLLAALVVVRGKFPPTVQLGLLFGVGLLMVKGETVASFFGSRPEGTLHAAWFAALVLLEAARLDDWDFAKLAGGAFLLTWASCLHYYATPAVAGLGVYVVWSVASLGWKAGRGRVAAMAGGALLFALPYAAVYVAPNWAAIAEVIRYHQAGADLGPVVLSPFRLHLWMYRGMSGAGYLPLALREALKFGIPLVVFSTILLGAVRATRGLALAALPLQLGILFFASHKPGVYLVHEFALFGAALAVAVLVVAVRRPWAMPAAAALLCWYLATGLPPLHAGQVHPADLARAATRQILGPQARVIGRPGAWYSGGGAAWHDYHLDLIGAASADYDPVRYLANFDAAVDYPFRSGYDVDNPERKTLSRWYAEGLLKLRGFYFAEQEGDLRIVLLGLKAPAALAGYAVRGGRVYRFDEAAAGDHEVIAATCPRAPAMEGAFSSAVLNLPDNAVMVTMLAPRPAASALGNSCSEILRVRGGLAEVDRDALIASLRRDDPPIRFYRHVEDVPGFQGVGVPASALPPDGMTPLAGAVDLAELEAGDPAARVEGTVVTTPAATGGYGGHLPLRGAEPIEFPHWARLRLKVLSGRIALGAITYDGTLVARTGSLLPSPAPLEVAVKLPPNAADVILYNAGDSGASRVEILEAAVVAPAGSGGVRFGVPRELVLPGGTRRVDGILKLQEAQPAAAVTTPPSRGGFAVSIPLHEPGRVAGVSWVQMRLKVRKGRVGFLVVGAKGEIVARTNVFLMPSAEVMDVALKVDALSRGTAVVVFNENLATASQVEILDAAVMVPDGR